MSSQFPLTRLAAKYAQVQTDGRILSNRKAIDVVDDRVIQLLERVDVDDAPDRMKRLIEMWEEYENCLDGGKAAEATAARNRIAAEFEKAYHDYEAWRQIFDALNLRSKLVDSEVKTMTAIKAILTVEDARNLQAQLLAAVMRVLEGEPKKLKQVIYEFTRITGDVSSAVDEEPDDAVEGGGGSGGGEV